jgi:hypothetical protein
MGLTEQAVLATHLFLPEYGDRAFSETFLVSECDISKFKFKFFKHFTIQ